METPNVPINFVPLTSGEELQLGTIKIRIQEDGSRTDMRIGTATLTVPPQTKGPPPHWHEMHDEVFLIISGRLQFHGLAGQTITAESGDHVTVPTRAPHTFSNPFDEECVLFNTFTPAHYINYFRLLADLGKKSQGQPMNPEYNRRAMAYFATIGVSEEEMKAPLGLDKGEQPAI